MDTSHVIQDFIKHTHKRHLITSMLRKETPNYMCFSHQKKKKKGYVKPRKENGISTESN